MSDLQTVSGLPVKKYWQGNVGRCDICRKTIKRCFVDGATQEGPWAKMCSLCSRLWGKGIGEGLGQVYQETECIDGVKLVTLWIKIKG